MPGLVGLMRDVQERSVRFVEVETPAAVAVRPVAAVRLRRAVPVRGRLAAGRAPGRRAVARPDAARRAARPAGYGGLRELLDPDAIALLARDLQRLSDDRRARDVEGVADLLRVLGPLTTAEAVERGATPGWLAELEEARRAIRVRIAGEERWVAVEDAGRLRDALGTPLPVGIPEAFLEPVRDPIGDLVARYARTHGPFLTGDVAARFGLGTAVVEQALARLAGTGRVVDGEFLPGGAGAEWCDAEVLRTLRRRSLAALRKEVEPVPVEALASFLPAWQQVGGRLRGAAGVLRVVEQLQGAQVPASALESLVLPVAGAGLLPRDARRAVRRGRGALAWARVAARDRRLGLAAPRRLRPPDPAGARPGRGQHPRAPGGRSTRWPVAAPSSSARSSDASARRGRRLDGRPGAGRRAVGPGLVRSRHQRHAGAAAHPGRGRRRRAQGPPRGPARPLRPQPARDAQPHRAAGRGRPLVPAAGGRGRPDPAGGTARRDAARPARRRDPRRGRWPSAHPAGSPRSTACSRPSRRPAGAAAATSSRASAPRSSPCPGAVDRLRAVGAAIERAGEGPRPTGADVPRALVLAATDPANPYGAAVPWPGARRGRRAQAGPQGRRARRAGRRAPGPLRRARRPHPADLGRRAGLLQPAVDALALAVRDGQLGRLTVERADGAGVLDSPLGRALEEAGFHATPRGLRLRG